MSGGQRRDSLDRICEEFARFQKTMEELRFLKLVAEDLKSLRRMIRLKKFD